MYAVDEVVPALEQRDIRRAKALLLPLSFGFRIEVFGLGGQDEVDELGFVQRVEEVF